MADVAVATEVVNVQLGVLGLVVQRVIVSVKSSSNMGKLPQ